MKKKIKFIQILEFIFWSVIIIMTFIEVYNEFENINISDFKSISFEDISILEYIKLVLAMLVFIFINAIFSMFKVFYLTVIYFGIKIANRIYKKERLEKVDFENDNYYRDIFTKYSPAVLSYLDDFKIDKEDVVATLLMLELKGKIKIKNENIILLDETTEKLEENEKYILNKVRDNTLKDINILEYTSIVKDDALKDGLLQEKQEIKKNITKTISINIIIFLFSILSFFIITKFLIIGESDIGSIINVVFIVLIFALFAFIPYITIVCIIHYNMLNTVDPYVRNEEGKMINLKLEGLRKYLTDFSKIEERTKEELTLWNEYLIYSVILGINTIVINEVYDKIK